MRMLMSLLKHPIPPKLRTARCARLVLHMRRVSLEFARADGTNLTEGQLIFISVVADLARDLYNEAWGHLSDNVAVVRRAATLFDVSTDQHIVDIAKGVVTKVGWNEGMPRFTNGVEVSWNDGMPRFTNGVDASSSTTGQIRGEASPFCSAKRNLQFSPIRQPREQTPRTPRTPWQGTLGSCGSGTFENLTEVTALEGLSASTAPGSGGDFRDVEGRFWR